MGFCPVPHCRVALSFGAKGVHEGVKVRGVRGAVCRWGLPIWVGHSGLMSAQCPTGNWPCNLVKKGPQGVKARGVGGAVCRWGIPS